MTITSAQKSIIIDTNFYISSLFEQETHHFETIRKINVYEKQNILICLPEPIVFEIISVMRRKNFSKHLIKNFYNKLTTDSNYKILHINFEELCQQGIDFPMRNDLKAIDYQFLLYCVKFEPNLIETYDNQIIKTLFKRTKSI